MLLNNYYSQLYRLAESTNRCLFKLNLLKSAFGLHRLNRREQLLKAAYYETLRDDAKVTNYYAEEVLKNLGAAK